jgi:hypothetical protein
VLPVGAGGVPGSAGEVSGVGSGVGSRVGFRVGCLRRLGSGAPVLLCLHPICR